MVSGVDGAGGEDVLLPAWRPDIGLVAVRNLREASSEEIIL